MKRTLEQIDGDIERAQEAYDEKFSVDHNTWEEFLESVKAEADLLGKLSREKRMMMDYTLSEIPSYADVMSLDDFIECVNEGGFIDYDGEGNYVLNGKETNISVRPSDVYHGTIRKEFDSVAWYNK